MNPVVVDAFALAIVAGYGPPAYPGAPRGGADEMTARRDAAAIANAMRELSRVTGTTGSYVSESDFFERDWQRTFWGANYPRLAAVKRRFDPDGLLVVHHGVGSENWTADGFTRLS
jgi:FAD/FMN-containing dehydrogenase